MIIEYKNHILVGAVQCVKSICLKIKIGKDVKENIRLDCVKNEIYTKTKANSCKTGGNHGIMYN